MVQEIPYKSAVTVTLNAGSNATGGIITKAVSMPGVAFAADSTGIAAVAAALGDVLEYPVMRVTRVESTIIEEEEE
jgi:ACR3 family arsenite efflux pump ArsB